MFLRVVRAPGGKRGIKHEYVRVVEAYRDHEGKTRHQTVINLGRKDLLAAHLDLDKLNRLLHGDKPGKPSVEVDDVGAMSLDVSYGSKKRHLRTHAAHQRASSFDQLIGP